MKTKYLHLIIVFSFFISLKTFAMDSVNYKTYSFNSLESNLGYPSETYFGSNKNDIFNLETYTNKDDTYYQDINTYLRLIHNESYSWNSISPEISKSIVMSMDSIFENIPALPNNIILFRGIDLKYRNNKSFKKGFEFIEYGYVSTSTSYKVADYFANKINENKKTNSLKAILVLYSTKANLKGILINQGEDEVLLKHGEKIRIMAVEKSNNYNLYLAQVCSDECEILSSPSALNFFKSKIFL
jgi:hypothetical protein